MKIRFTLLFAVLMLSASLAGAQEHKGPRIAIPEVRYDFGKVAQGVQASHIFEIKNTGDQTLVIERVQPG